ncbi:MAG TPA: rhomboid family intramembrane serine protease [Bryobacteraceae bacterium]|nr:rhomboid family intramembrane serine protease [Bryobacteraceae bacterium]
MRYTRYPTRRSSFFGYFPTGVKWLLLTNTAVFLLTTILPYAPVRTLFSLTWAGVVHNFYIWQPFTYLFLHGGIWHLLINMLTLWMFGVQLEQDWGTRQFLKYYFLCGIGAGICILLVNGAMGAYTVPTIGASGAIMGLLMAFGVLYPNQRVLMDFLFPIKAKYLVLIYVIVELWASFGPNTGISSVAHLGGMVVGYIYLKSGGSWRWPDWQGAYREWKHRRARKKFQVYMRKHGGDRWVN